MQLIRKEILVNGKSTDYDNIHYAAIRALSEEFQGCRYLEIGTAYGHSAFQAWTALKPKKITLVDTFIEERQLPFILRTLIVLGCTAEVEVLKGDSHDILPKIKDKFNVGLVDGDHTGKGSLRDLNDAWNLLEINGALIFDDIIMDKLREVSREFKLKNDIYEYKEYFDWKKGVAIMRKH